LTRIFDDTKGNGQNKQIRGWGGVLFWVFDFSGKSKMGMWFDMEIGNRLKIRISGGISEWDSDGCL